MTLDKLNLSAEYSNALKQILGNDGLSQNDIDEIINGSYREYATSDDLSSYTPAIFKTDEYIEIINDLADGYTFDEIIQRGTSIEKVKSFENALSQNGLTIDSVKAFNEYSSGSNMILSVKRGVPRESIIESINYELNSRLTEYGFEQSQISQIKNMVNSLDYKRPVHENYSEMNYFLDKLEIPKKFKRVVNTTVKSLDSYYHLDETLANLDEGLKIQLPESIKLTRAVKSDFLMRCLGNVEDFNSLVGKRIEEIGYSSTSPLYDASFAKYDKYDIVFDIYAPKGTQGTLITPFSSYGNVEEEVLLNSNDLYIIEVTPDVIDKNGKKKTVLKSLILSKDKQCYKGIGLLDKKQEIPDLENATKEQLVEIRKQMQQQNELHDIEDSCQRHI